MNKVILIGRLIDQPKISVSGEMTIARYTLAVDRKIKKEGQPTADFITCVAFGKNGEFADKYLRKGTKICVEGRIQTGSYTNKDGQKIYTTDINVESHEFVEKKEQAADVTVPIEVGNDFVSVSDDLDADGLPF